MSIYCFLGGTLTINSSNPFDPPLINPNFLTSHIDIEFAKEGIRLARQLFLRVPGVELF